MSNTIARLQAISRAPFDSACVSAVLAALTAQARLCETAAFRRLDTYSTREPAGGACPANDRLLAPAAVQTGLPASMIGAARAAASLVGAILGGAVLGMVSLMWLSLNLAVGLMAAVYRVGWARVFVAMSPPAGVLPPLSTPGDTAEGSAQKPSAARARLSPAAALDLRGRTSGSESGGRIGGLGPQSASQRLQRAALSLTAEGPPPMLGARHARARRRASTTPLTSRLDAAFVHAGASLSLLQPSLHPRVESFELERFRSRLLQAAQTPAASVPRSQWLDEAVCQEGYVPVAHSTPVDSPTPSETLRAQLLGQSMLGGLKDMWQALGRATSAAAPETGHKVLDVPHEAPRPAARWPLALQRSTSEPWSAQASEVWRTQRRWAGTQDSFVRIVAPSLPSAKTRTGPRLPHEGLGAFLQRLRDDGQGEQSAYEGGSVAFVVEVRRLYAQNMQHEAGRAMASVGPLGLDAQFIKDIRRHAFYVFAQGLNTAPGDAFELNARLDAHWDAARTPADNLLACEAQLAPWLDTICPRARGLLRQDATFEASQAALAAACQAVQLHARPGALVTPTDQKSTEFVMWPGADDHRVHIVGIVQYGSMQVMHPDADDDVQAPLYPFRMHLHLSVGARYDAQAPKDIQIHEGNWNIIAPW